MEFRHRTGYGGMIPAAAETYQHSVLIAASNTVDAGKLAGLLHAEAADMSHVRSLLGRGKRSNMSSFTFDEAGNAAQLPKELGDHVIGMLGNDFSH